MNRRRWPVSLIGSTIVFLAISAGLGQNTPEVRRALPANEPPTARAVPFETPTPAPSPRPRRAPAVAPAEDASVPSEESTAPTEATPTETEAPDRRQLEYANALFGRKLYDLAIPEYEKFLGQFPGAPGRASAYFFLGESYRALNRSAAARTSFQSVLDEYGESEFAGPAAYGVAEILFTQKDYAGSLPLFHRAAAKTKQPALALSARYFEARCLENLDRKDEAREALPAGNRWEKSESLSR